MNQLQNLVDTLEAQDKIKKDFVAPTQNLHFANGKLTMMVDDQPITFTPSTVFHQQVSEKLGIPKGYYDKMVSKAVNLLDQNVNHWLTNEGKNILLRSFVDPNGDNTARAFLSDRYNMIDNMEVLIQLLEAIKESGIEVDIEKAEISETRMFLSVVAPQIEMKAAELLKFHRRSIAAGTSIITGFRTENSEIGYGAYVTSPRAKILSCQNGLVDTKNVLRRVHLGGKLDELGFEKVDAIRNANRKLVKEQIKHAVKKFLSIEYLTEFVDRLTFLGDKKIDAPINPVIEVIAKDYGFTQETKANLLDHFIRGGDVRRIGMVNAITEMVQDFKDVDQRNDTESLAVGMLENFDRIEAAAIKLDRSQN